MDPLTLSTATVRLRPHRADDLDGIVDQCLDPETVRWTTVPEGYTRRHAEEFLERVAAGWRAGRNLSFAVTEPRSDEFLGTVGVAVTGAGTGEVGFGLRAAARGRGLMSAALRLLAGWTFDGDGGPGAGGGPGLQVLHWRASVGNWPSRRVAWSVGFRVEGTVRGLCDGEPGWFGSLHRDDPRRPVRPWLRAPVLRGPGCRLRPFLVGDAGAVVEACNDPVTRHWLADLPRPYTAGHALGYIQSREEEHAAGRAVYWAAADPATDRCIGSFGLMDLDRGTGTAEVGYWVHPDARGRGVATEAVRLIARHATAPPAGGGLGLRRLELAAAAGNTASQRVAERAGFHRTGIERSAERVGDGTFVDLVRYDLLATDGTP